MSRVKIVTDSACDVSDSELQQLGVGLVPLAIRFGDEELIDRVQLSNEEFWTRSQASHELPSTAAPSAADFATEFQKAAENGADSVVCITLSSELSATHQAASKGAESVAADIPVHVIDSLSCTVAQGNLCRHAARLAADGLAPESIVAEIEAMKPRLRLLGALDTLENLRKGGRIGAAGALFASLLSVKPIIQISDGKVVAESRQRTRKRSLDHLAALVEASRPVEQVAVAHSGAPDIDDFLTDLRHHADEILVSMVGPVIGTHGGPRLIAVAFLVPA